MPHGAPHGEAWGLAPNKNARYPLLIFLKPVGIFAPRSIFGPRSTESCLA